MEARFSAVLVCFAMSCAGGLQSCVPVKGPCGAPTQCPAGQVRVCQGKCVAPLARGAACAPEIDCNNPQTCDPTIDACLPSGGGGNTCQQALTVFQVCTPGSNDCGAGLYCLAREDFGGAVGPDAPPGFCVFDRGEGGSCIGQTTHTALACESGLICAAYDGVCHALCATDADCPCGSGESCIDRTLVNPPVPRRRPEPKACYQCADRPGGSGTCDVTHPCCQRGAECQYNIWRFGVTCCEPRGASCDPALRANVCCGSDVCIAGAGGAAVCQACTATGAACTSSGQCCGAQGGACCGNKCANIYTDQNNCGSCGHVCPRYPNALAPSCLQGTCTFTCAPGFADCNGILADGCETDLRDDPNNCGVCKHSCGTGSACNNGECTRPPPPPPPSTCLPDGVYGCVPARFDGLHCCGTDSGQTPQPGQSDEECVFQWCRACARNFGDRCDGKNGDPSFCCQARKAGDPVMECTYDFEMNTNACHIPDGPPLGGGGGSSRVCTPPGASCRIKTPSGIASAPCCTGTCSAAGVCPSPLRTSQRP